MTAVKRYSVWNDPEIRAVTITGFQAAKTTAKLRAESITRWPEMTWKRSKYAPSVLHLVYQDAIVATIRPTKESA